MNVLVTGGTGFLGGYVTRGLLARGDRVRVLARCVDAGAGLREAGAELWPGDLRDPAGVSAACVGMDAVCHAGALSAPWGKRSEFSQVNVGGTEHVINGCRQHGVRRLVYVSSPSVVFDGRDQHQAREDTPYPRRFTSVYSHTKKLGEDRVNDAGRSGLEAVILRPKAIFGPGDTSLLPRLVAAGRSRRLPQIGDGCNRVDFTYVENAAQAVLAALDSREAVGRTYTITNGEPVLLWELIRKVLAHAGCETRLRRISAPAAHLLAFAMEARAAVTGREPLLTRYTVAILARTQTYDITAARRDLGYVPAVPMEQAVRLTLEALERDRHRA